MFLSLGQFLGLLIVVLGVCCFLVNVFVMYVFAAKGLTGVGHENYAIYRLIFNFLICDAIQVTPTIYLGLCALLQVELLSDKLTIIPGTINLWCWNQMLLMLITMAVNRYVGICHFNRYSSIFTAQLAGILIVATWLISGTYVMIQQFVVPCCAMVSYYPVYTFLRLLPPAGEEDLVKKYSPPNNYICCGILLFCYVRILWKVHRSGREALSTMGQAVQRRRIRQNIRFAVQFVFISLFFILMFAFYNIFPRLLPAGVQLPYAAIAFCMVAHCTVNAVMYLCFNPEVKRLALLTLGGATGKTSQISRSNISQARSRSQIVAPADLSMQRGMEVH